MRMNLRVILYKEIRKIGEGLLALQRISQDQASEPQFPICRGLDTLGWVAL